jgi:hypothetical protein
MRVFYAQPCILSHGSLDLISACVQPFPLFWWEIIPADYGGLIIVLLATADVRIQ